MKKNYEKLATKIIRFETNDVITASGEPCKIVGICTDKAIPCIDICSDKEAICREKEVVCQK